MAVPEGGGVHRSVSPSSRLCTTPSSSMEVSSPAVTEDQTDPFECCDGNPCAHCVLYQRRWGRTTGAARSQASASRGSIQSPAALGSNPRTSAAQAVGGGCGGTSPGSGDSGKASDSSSEKSPPKSPVMLSLSPRVYCLP